MMRRFLSGFGWKIALALAVSVPVALFLQAKTEYRAVDHTICGRGYEAASDWISFMPIDDEGNVMLVQNEEPASLWVVLEDGSSIRVTREAYERARCGDRISRRELFWKATK